MYSASRGLGRGDVRTDRSKGLNLHLTRANVASYRGEVIVNGKERVGLEFPKNPSQFLFDPVDCVEEGTTIDVEPLAAQLPVSAENKMESKQLVLSRSQVTSTDAAEIGDVFFTFARVAQAPVFAGRELERDALQRHVRICAFLKPAEADAENIAKYTIARGRRGSAACTYSQSMAIGAVAGSERQCFRSSPFHFVSVFPFFFGECLHPADSPICDHAILREQFVNFFSLQQLPAMFFRKT